MPQNDPYGSLLGSSQGPAADPYGALVDGPGKIRAALTANEGQDQQGLARARQIARELSVPVEAVKALPDEMAREARINHVDNATLAAPTLRKQFSDADFATLAEPEAPLLAKIEKGIQDTVKFTMGADGSGGLPSYAAKSAQLAYHQSMRGLSGVSRAATDLLDQFLPNFDPSSPDLLRAFSENSARVSAYHDAKAKEITYQGNVVGEGVQSGISSTLSQAKYMPLLAFGPAGAAAALGGMIAETFGQTYNEHRDAGNAPIASLMQAIPDAGIEGGTEVGPMFNLATDLAKGTPFLKSLVKQAFPEIKGEEVATFFQDFNQWVRDPNPNKKFSDFIAERPRAAVVTAIATLFGTGGNIAISNGIDRAMEGQLQREWEPVIKQHDALQALIKQASGSQVRELDPEMFRKFVQAAADNTEGAPKSAFVDGRVLGEVLQQAGITPDVLAQTMPSIASQLEAAHQSNSPVEIPLGELATALPGTPLEEALLPHLRMDGPESLSQVEAVSARDSAKELLAKKFSDVVQQAHDSERMAQGAKMVQDAMHAQLMATGRMSEDVAARNSALVRDYYTVMAGYLNTTPDALWIKQQYSVANKGKETGVLTDTGKAGALTVEGYHYSTQARPIISGHAYGSGLKGSNAELYTTAADKRLRNRSYFYVDTGNGITPEAGVGGIGHRVNLSNIYDANSDPLRLRKGGQLAFESAVLDRGYDGYLDRLSGTQPGQVVVLGDKQINAEVLGPLGKTTGKKAPPMVERPSRGRDQVVDRVSANKTLPAGSPSLERWGEILKAQMPDDYAAMQDAGVFEGDLAKPIYKSELVKLFESKTENPVYEQGALGKGTDANILHQGARATLADFSPETIGDILKKNDWSILTAENPMGEQATPEENATKMVALKADLDAMGAQYVEAVGKYGQVENSLVVTGITQEEAVALGAKYAQDSVLTKRGLVYPRTGDVTPVTGKVDVFADAPEDFYTTIPSTGAKFAIELDWREGAADYSIRKTDTGFEALDVDGKRIGKLNSNITPEQSKQLNESASVDHIGVDKERQKQGIGSALYAAWSDAHEGRIAPSGKTSADAWRRWKADYPEKVAEFVQQEAMRLAQGSPESQVLGNITDPEIKQAVVDAVPNKYQAKYAAGRNPNLLNQEEKAQYNALATPQTETAAFKEWFGDSKVVDAKGEPLVVYHAAPEGFDTFRPSFRGAYFATLDPEFANAFAAGDGYENDIYVDGTTVLPLYVKAENPFDYENPEHVAAVAARVSEIDKGGANEVGLASGQFGIIESRPVQRALKDLGFDSFYVEEMGTKNIGVFNREQLKSALGNNGQFSPTNPNLLAQPAEKEVIRGTFDVETMTTVLNPEANLSTFLHETGHFFLEMTMQLAAGPDAPPQIVKMSQDLLKSFGIKDLDTWHAMTVNQKRKHHERFAETFELYLLEGKAPSVEQQSAFRVFSSWLKRVYQSAKAFAEGKGITLDPDLTSVMDRMLATEEQIKNAEETAGLIPNFDATSEANEKLNARSIRDLKWAVNARNKFIKAMQMEAKDTRRNVKAEVTAEVNGMDVFKAKEQLAKMRKENGEQLNTTELTIMAEGYGFKGVDDMLKSIDAAGNKADVIEGMTDQRMLERHGDLSDQAAIEQAATEAVHNQARAKALATELTAQQEMLNTREDTGKTNAAGRKITVNAMVAAAKQFAQNVIGKRKISDLKKAAWAHTQAERRAGHAWQDATKKGDTKAAVQAKQDQLLNNAAVREAQDAMRQVQETLAFFAKVTKGNNETVVEKGRDPDVVNAARVILAAYGYAPFKGKAAAEYLDLVKQNNPDVFSVIEEGVRNAITNAKPMKDLTTDELIALRDEVASLWHLAKSSRHYEVAGKAMDIDDISERITERLVEKGVPDVMPGDFHAPTKADGSRTMLQFAGALLRRTEAWSQTMDGKFGGPFLRFVFQPIKDAANRYNNDRVAYRKKYQALVENLAPSLKQGEIAAPELGYTFGHRESADHPNLGAAELTAALLHLGNESNKRKLLLGRGWATEVNGVMDTSRWDAFMERMHREGTINKAHYDFAQGVWDMLESMKPLAQQAHRDAFGRYFSEVTAESFEVPDIGFYRGGYVPAQTDPRMVKDHEVSQLRELENQSMAYAFPSVSKGFTISRTEYNRPLMLNLNTLSQHMDKVLLFSHMTGPVRGVGRVLSDKAVAYNLNRVDPAAISGLLTPWLKRSASQQVETPMIGDGKLSRVASIVRSRAGMSLMFANISNTVQQITGFALASVKVKPTHLASATAEYIKAPRQMAENVANASPYMANRMENEISAINAAMEDILVNPTTYQKAKTWTNRHGYFMQSALDNVMSTIVWTGAFNQATEQGMTQADAIQFADGSVRQTQGANAAEDVSRIEVGPAYARLFTQFYGYFSMMANTNATAIENLVEEFGLKKGMAKAVPVVLMGYMASAWIAEAIAQAFKGGPDDEDKDGSYLGDWLRAVFVNGSLKAVLAAVPFAGQFAGTMFNTWNSKPYDDKTSVSPGISMLDNAVRAPHTLYKAIAEGGSKQAAVRDVGTAISMSLGLPTAPLARPLGYAAGVAAGEIQPTGPGDFTRGMLTGTASPESKR